MANLKISELTSAAGLTGAELVPIVQGTSTVKTTSQDIANLASGGSQTINIEAIGGTFNYPGDQSGPSSGGSFFSNILSVSNSFSGTKDLFRIPLPWWIFSGMSYMTQPTATSVIISKTPKAIFQVQYLQNLQSIEFSDLEGLYAYSQYGQLYAGMTIQFNNALTTVSFPKVEFISAVGFNFSFNAFSQTTVDYIIELFALYAETYVPGDMTMTPMLSLDGGTNAAPSQDAQPDITTLTNKGWMINYN